MRRLAITATLLALLAPVTFAREWTSATGGSKIDADYYARQEGLVILRKANGDMIKVPLDKLSAADQQFVSRQPVSAALTRPADQEVAAAAPAGPTDRFSQAVEQNPNDPGAYYTRGMARINKGQHADALADFSKAIQLKPDFAAAFDGRGVALSKSGKPLEAHVDFDKALELDPELASAYRHRGDNMEGLWKTPQGEELIKQRSETYREKYEMARTSNLTKTPWQPLNTTAGNVLPALNQMRQVDYIRAREIEDAYGGGAGGGGYGVGGGGLTIDNGGVKIVNGGLTVVNPGTTIVGNPALAVFPEEVVKGQTITLVANPAELAKAMPVQLDANGKPVRVKGAYGEAPRQPVYGVDFYRDVDGDGLLNPDADEYLATDNNNKDGFTAEVSTAAFPPGNQAYFAVGRGQQPAGVPATYGQAAEAIRKAAATEREIAEKSQAAADSSGYSTEQAQSLRGDQKRIGESAAKMASAFAQTAPDAAQLLASAVRPMQAADTRLDAAEKRPGVPSIAKAAAEKATEAADLLDQAYAKLAERAQGEEDGKGSPSPAAPAGAPAVASGLVKPATAGPAAVAGGPRTGRPAGGNYSGDDDKDININVRRDGDDDDRDINITVNDDDDDVDIAVRDTIDRALGYIDDDDDYDAAVVEYDKYIEKYPNNDDLLIHRADAYVQRGSYDYAVQDYDRLVALNVESADLYYNRGCALLAAGHVEPAIADFDKSIALDETRNLAYTNRGSAKARLGQYEKAVVDFNRALDLEPRDELALRNRALAFKKLDQIEKYNADLKRLHDLSQPAVGE